MKHFFITLYLLGISLFSSAQQEEKAALLIVQVEQPSKIEPQIPVPGFDQSVELPVHQVPLHTERIVIISVDPQSQDLARHFGVGVFRAEFAVYMHIQREGTEQIVFQQLAQLQTGRFHIAQHTATAVAQRAHLQQIGRASCRERV